MHTFHTESSHVPCGHSCYCHQGCGGTTVILSFVSYLDIKKGKIIVECIGETHYNDWASHDAVRNEGETELDAAIRNRRTDRRKTRAFKRHPRARRRVQEGW